MNSRTARTADSKAAKGGTRLGQKRPAMLSLEEPTKKMTDSVPLLGSSPSVHRRAQTTVCPMTPMTPDLDIEYVFSPQTAGGLNVDRPFPRDSCESPSRSRSSSTSSTFTFNLLTPTTSHHEEGFSFTACPTSPSLDESMVYALPPRKRPTSTSFPTRSWRRSADHSDLPVIFSSALLSEDPVREGMQSTSDDRKYFHVQFLQEDSPFPKTPDC
jgi:hypothetical protein